MWWLRSGPSRRDGWIQNSAGDWIAHVPVGHPSSRLPVIFHLTEALPQSVKPLWSVLLTSTSSLALSGLLWISCDWLGAEALASVSYLRSSSPE